MGKWRNATSGGSPRIWDGIHNPNTDLVIVMNPPLNAMVLLQQLGRAGRCGNQSNAIVLIDNCYWQQQHHQQQQTGSMRARKQRGLLKHDQVDKEDSQAVELLYDQMTCIRQSFAKIFGDSSTTANSITPCRNCDRCVIVYRTDKQPKTDLHCNSLCRKY